MRRFLYVTMTLFVVVCFCGTPFSVAGDMEEAANALDLGVERAAPGAIADKNYIGDVWASDGTGADSSAVRVFSSGSTVRLHVNYYMAAAGTVIRYYMVGNAAGSLAYFSAYSESVTTGEHHRYLSLSTLTPGTYFFTLAITMTDNNAMSPTPYWFVIE